MWRHNRENVPWKVCRGSTRFASFFWVTPKWCSLLTRFQSVTCGFQNFIKFFLTQWRHLCYVFSDDVITRPEILHILYVLFNQLKTLKYGTGVILIVIKNWAGSIRPIRSLHFSPLNKLSTWWGLRCLCNRKVSLQN